MFKNEIFLKKKLKVLCDGRTSDTPQYSLVGAFLKNVESLGFTLSPDLINKLLYMDLADINALHGTMSLVLKEMVGDNVVHKVMYPNFPTQVMEASDAELYINAVLHYISFQIYDFTGGVVPTWLPEYEKAPREKLKEATKLKVIDVGTNNEFYDIFTEILMSTTSVSEFDKQILEWFVDNMAGMDVFVPEEIPHKEQMAFVLGKFINKGIFIAKPVKTATDVLRIAVSMSGGDISLAEPCKFRNFTRRERRGLLFLLENVGSNILEDMQRFKNRWIRLGEKINPGDYWRTFSLAADAFQKLRKGYYVQSFSGKTEKFIKEGYVENICEHLKKRPGEFARNLDRILRNTYNVGYIITHFASVANSISTPVLIQMHGHFRGRLEKQDLRFFFPKGQVAKAYVVPNDLEPLEWRTVRSVLSVIEEALKYKFSESSPMNEYTNVYIDPALDQIAVPLTMRSQLAGLNVIPRGSRLELSNKNFLRFFIHWRNLKRKIDNRGWSGDTRVDLDLSCDFYLSDWENVGHVSYINLRYGHKDEYLCYHSGDITNSPKGSSEFIDIDRKGLMANGVRYVVPSIYSFTNNPFYDIPECFFGWMDRKNIKSGGIFEPKTVAQKFNLTSESNISVPCVIDLHDNKVIWTDLSYKNIKALNNVESVRDGTTVILKANIEKQYMTLYELLELHATGTGCYMLDENTDSDMIDESYTMENIDIGVIMSEYMK